MAGGGAATPNCVPIRERTVPLVVTVGKGSKRQADLGYMLSCSIVELNQMNLAMPAAYKI